MAAGRPEEEFLKSKLSEGHQQVQLPPHYDTDAFDSMAVVNSEAWSESRPDEKKLTRSDLLPHGPEGLSTDDLGATFLRAAESGVLEVARDLYKFCGPDILTTTDEDGYTALHRASYNGHLEVVEFVLSVGAKVDARTVDGWQPLHSACRWNKASVASLLLQNGALINAQTNGRLTPLHLAACNDRAEETMVLLLTQRDVDVSLQNGQDETALTIAERSGRYSYLFEMTNESIDYRIFLQKALN